MRYLFGNFVFDDGTFQLVGSGSEVALGAKGFELLDLLIRARPKVLSRTRLHAALWPHAHVGSTSLHVLVSQVRAALRDDPEDPQWIRTVHGVGYAFRGDVRTEGEETPGRETPARAKLSQGDREWSLRPGAHVIGRGDDAAVSLDVAGVSRHHARLVVGSEGATLEDLGSKNGTFVGEERLSAKHRLAEGDVIRLGRHTRLVFRFDLGDRTETEGEPGRRGRPSRAVRFKV